MTNRDKYLTLTEVAAKSGVSERTIRRRIDKGEIGAEKVDGKLMVLAESITELTEMDTYVNRDKILLLKELQQTVSSLRRHVSALEEQLVAKDAQLREKDEDLRRKDEQLAEASHRHDTVVMQIAKMLEYERQPFWRRWRKRKALQVPEGVVDMGAEDENQS
jgi:excisionase family DNA binding protein